MKHGYSFHWPAYRNPYMLCPNGKRIDLEVDDFIPYLVEGKPVVSPAKRVKSAIRTVVRNTIAKAEAEGVVDASDGVGQPLTLDGDSLPISVAPGKALGSGASREQAQPELKRCAVH